MSNRDKAEAIRGLRQEYKIGVLLDRSGMASSTYYDNIQRLDAPDKYAEQKKRIKEIFERSGGTYGYRRITMQLHADGICLNHKTVLRLMSELGIAAKRKQRRYNSYKGTTGEVADNIVNRDFHSDEPRKKLTTDVTMIKIKEEKAYLSPVLDMHNGEIVVYVVTDSPGMAMANGMVDLLKKEAGNLKGAIFHSDQGWQYQHKEYQKSLKDAGIIQSMSRKGNCYDNAIMENFFGIMKTELLYANEWNSMGEFIEALHKYIYFYNNERIKLKFGKSPVQVRLDYERTHQKIEV